MMKRLTLCLAVVSALAFVGGAALGTTALPYMTNFNATAGAEWTAASIVIDSANGPDGATNFATVVDGTMLDITDNDYGNAWFHCYTKMTTFPAGFHPDPITNETSSAFFLGDDGNLYANSNQTWTSVQTGLSTNGGQWLGIAVHLDYTTDQWDIYTTTNFNTAMTKRNSSPLAMNTDAGNVDLTNVVVEGTVSLDDVALARGTTTVDTDTFTSLKPRTEVAQSSNRWIICAVPLHSYSDPNDNLDGVLGNELMIGMSQDDSIRFYGTNGYQVYNLAGGAWTGEGAAPLPGTITPEAGEVMWRRFASDTPARVTFFSETFNPDVIDAISYAATDVILQGTNIAGSAGWNVRRWTTTTTKTPSGSGLDLATCPVGSRLYQITLGSARYKRSDMIGTDWRGEVTPFAKGDTIWIYLNDAGTNLWTVIDQ